MLDKMSRRSRKIPWLGILILLIVYGKDKRAIKDMPRSIVGLLGVLIYFWVLCILGLFFAENIVLPLIMVVGYPAAIAIWAMIARKRYRKVANILSAMDSQETNTSGENGDKEKLLSEGSDPNQLGIPARKKGKYLECPDCGRTQLSSRRDCWNCKRIFEEQDYEYIEQSVCNEPEVSAKTKKKYLVCPDCGRTQLSSRRDCWNCKRVFEEQDYEYE